MLVEFIKYQHVERFGNDEVQGIELGTVFVFPKIDGANTSVWMNNGEIQCSSRNQRILPGETFQGFPEYVKNHHGIGRLLESYPHLRLYGEWLVKHSLATYREDAWRKWYVFDMCVDVRPEDMAHGGADRVKYMPYETYKPILDEFGIEYIPPLAIVKNGTYERFVRQLESNVFLIADGKGVGEGVVLKNYDYFSKYGRQTWAKIVRAEFKEIHTKTMGAPKIDGGAMVEEAIVKEFVTVAIVDKVKANIESEMGGWTGKHIPRLLNTVFHDLVTEETWAFLKKHKNPTVNFKTLLHFVIAKVKAVKPELF
jgi:hypothetical protein